MLSQIRITNTVLVFFILVILVLQPARPTNTDFDLGFRDPDLGDRSVQPDITVSRVPSEDDSRAEASKVKIAVYIISCLAAVLVTLCCFYCCKHCCFEGCRGDSTVTATRMELLASENSINSLV